MMDSRVLRHVSELGTDVITDSDQMGSVRWRKLPTMPRAVKWLSVGSRKFTYSFDKQFRVAALPSLHGFDGGVMP